MKLYQSIYYIIKKEESDLEKIKKYFKKKYFENNFNEKELNKILLKSYNIYYINNKNKITLYNKNKIEGKNIFLKKEGKEWSNIYKNDKLIKYIKDKKLVGGDTNKKRPRSLSEEITPKKTKISETIAKDIDEIIAKDIDQTIEEDDIDTNDIFTRITYNEYKKDFLINHLNKLSNIKYYMNNPFISYDKYKYDYLNDNINIKNKIVNILNSEESEKNNMIDDISDDIILIYNGIYKTKSLTKKITKKRLTRKYRSIGGNKLTSNGNKFLSILHVFDKKHDFFKSIRFKNMGENKNLNHFVYKNDKIIYDDANKEINKLIPDKILNSKYIGLYSNETDYEESLLIHTLDNIKNGNYCNSEITPLFSFLKINDISFKDIYGNTLNNETNKEPLNIILKYIKNFYKITGDKYIGNDIDIKYKYRYLYDTSVKINKRNENSKGISWRNIISVIKDLALEDVTIESRWDPHTSSEINVNEQNIQNYNVNDFYTKYLQNITDESFNNTIDDIDTAFRKITKDNFKLKYHIYNKKIYTSLEFINTSGSFIDNYIKSKNKISDDRYYIKERDDRAFYYINNNIVSICWITYGFSVNILLNKILELELELESDTKTNTNKKRKFDDYDDDYTKNSKLSKKSKNNRIDEDDDNDDDDNNDKDDSINYIIIKEIVYYLKQKNIPLKHIINILYDFKKSGDWGQSLYCLNSNKKNIVDNIFISGDKLCALHSLLRLNVKTIFGIERKYIQGDKSSDNTSRISMLGFYNGNSDITIKQFLDIFIDNLVNNILGNNNIIRAEFIKILNKDNTKLNRFVNPYNINNEKNKMIKSFVEYLKNGDKNSNFNKFKDYIKVLIIQIINKKKDKILENLVISNFNKDQISQLYDNEIQNINIDIVYQYTGVDFINNFIKIINILSNIFYIFDLSFCKFNNGNELLNHTLLDYYLIILNKNLNEFSLFKADFSLFKDQIQNFIKIKKLKEKVIEYEKIKPDNYKNIIYNIKIDIDNLLSQSSIAITTKASNIKGTVKLRNNADFLINLKKKLKNYFIKIKKGDDINNIMSEINNLINEHDNDLKNYSGGNKREKPNYHITNMVLYIYIILDELEENIINYNMMIDKYFKILNIEDLSDNLNNFIKNKYKESVKNIFDTSIFFFIKKNIKEILDEINLKYGNIDFRKKDRIKVITSFNNYCTNMNFINDFLFNIKN